MKKNILIVSGPSGSGKSTLIKMLCHKYPIQFSVSHTTRPPRKDEVSGREYYFISEAEFSHMVAQELFIEWAQVHHYHYGTSWQEIKNKSTQEDFLVLDIDVQGARIIKKKVPQAVYVFIVPSSAKELRNRLIHREGTVDKETEKIIDDRILKAKQEIEDVYAYDYLILNDQLEKAFSALEAVYLSILQTVVNQEKITEKLIRSFS